MSDITNIDSKHQPIRWLIGVMMLFSIFTFAGFSGGIGQDFRQAVKTERTISKDVKVVIHSISYKRAYGLCNHQTAGIDFGQNFQSLTRVHTQLVKIKFDELSTKKYLYHNYFHYFQINIPGDSDDDISVALAG